METLSEASRKRLEERREARRYRIQHGSLTWVRDLPDQTDPEIEIYTDPDATISLQ